MSDERLTAMQVIEEMDTWFDMAKERALEACSTADKRTGKRDMYLGMAEGYVVAQGELRKLARHIYK